MGRDDENLIPENDNLKSLLKKPGSKVKSNNRVVFNEKRNEFFDADYIILIRECEYDDDDEDEGCLCNEMLSRITCDSQCGCNGFEPQSPKFVPPLEFIDAVTLSPPEGYKDMKLEDPQLISLQQTSIPRTTVCRECFAIQEKSGKDDNPFKTELTASKKQNKTPVSGILKGGLYWKHQQNSSVNVSIQATDQTPLNTENICERAVHFIEDNDKTNQIGYDKKPMTNLGFTTVSSDNDESTELSSVESTEMMLTFKLGNKTLVSNKSLRPNSAVRQLFPNTEKRFCENESSEQIFMNAESIIFSANDKEVAKPPQIIESCERRIFEYGTFRRSLIRYTPKRKKNVKRGDNSLVERIKLLTCDLDDNCRELDNISEQISPSGEEPYESQETSDGKSFIKSISPSSSSTTSSNSSSVSSTYKKITDLFIKKEKNIDIDMTDETNQKSSIPNKGDLQSINLNKCYGKVNTTMENKKQLLSTLVPLAACVSVNNSNDCYYNVNSVIPNSEKVTEDSNEKIIIKTEQSKVTTPDVLAGTPLTEPTDKLSLFIQHDISRTTTVEKYQTEDYIKKDDENDDYGFNRRPSVQCVKPRFDGTTDVFNQIQNHLDISGPITKLTWPYYSENGFTEISKNESESVPEAIRERQHNKTLYSSTLFNDENVYQNYLNKKLTNRIYNTNLNTDSTVIGIEVNYNEYYSPSSKMNNRPLSPPPQDFSKNYHTMVYIPYNHIDGCPSFISSSQCRQQNKISKLNNPNLLETECEEALYQKMYQLKVPSQSNILPLLAHNSTSMYCRSSESPLSGQTSVKSTQTLSTPLLECRYFQNMQCKSNVWESFGNCNTRNSGHGYPSVGTRHMPSIKTKEMNGDINFQSTSNKPSENKNSTSFSQYLSTQITNSTTKLNIMQRGVPEGADNVHPIILTKVKENNSNSISISSPSSSPHFKSFYAMNV